MEALTGKEIKVKLIKRGMSQKDLAKEIDVSYSWLNKVLRSEDKQGETIRKMITLYLEKPISNKDNQEQQCQK